MTGATRVSSENDEPSNAPFQLATSEDDDDEHPVSLSPSSSVDETPSTTHPVETFDDKELNKLYDDWLALDAELRAFEPKHKDYVSKVDEVESLKTKYRHEFDKYKKKLDQLEKDLVRVRKSYAKKGQ